jgi:hypothetical protein
MTEQERVLLAINALSALAFVQKSPARLEKWSKSLTPVTSSAISELLGIEVDVVEAAVRNVGEAVAI